jgi:hypothetical protein
MNRLSSGPAALNRHPACTTRIDPRRDALAPLRAVTTQAAAASAAARSMALFIALAVTLCAPLPVRAAAPDEAPLDLRFGDFFVAPIGRAGLVPTERLLAAQGRRVRLTGYMVAQERPRIGHFFLTPRPVSMSVHSDGDADDLPPATVLVQMPPADAARPVLRTRGLLQLTGRLQVGRHEMADGRVVWVRLLLEPRPVPPESADAVAAPPRS